MAKRKYDYVFQEVLKPLVYERDNNTCRSCGIRRLTRVYVNSSGDYVECDDFMEEWAKANKKRVFSLGLEVVRVDLTLNIYELNNLIALCPKCARKYRKEFKRRLRREIRQGNMNQAEFFISVANMDESITLVLLRKEIYSKTGQKLPTKDLKEILDVLK